MDDSSGDWSEWLCQDHIFLHVEAFPTHLKHDMSDILSEHDHKTTAKTVEDLTEEVHAALEYSAFAGAFAGLQDADGKPITLPEVVALQYSGQTINVCKERPYAEQDEWISALLKELYSQRPLSDGSAMHLLHHLAEDLTHKIPVTVEKTEEAKKELTAGLSPHSSTEPTETVVVVDELVHITGHDPDQTEQVQNHSDILSKLDHIVAHDSLIEEATILEFHGILMGTVMEDDVKGGPGRYRECEVIINHCPEATLVRAEQVKPKMQEYWSWLKVEQERYSSPTVSQVIELACEAHCRFVAVHPFKDGNGRIARLLFNLILLRAGYPLTLLSGVPSRTHLPAVIRPLYLEAVKMWLVRGERALLIWLAKEAVIRSLLVYASTLRGCHEPAHSTMVDQAPPAHDGAQKPSQ